MKTQACRLIVVQILALALLVGHTQAAGADFAFVSESAVFNPATQEVTFRITFNQAPDFSTVDGFGRQATSFQYVILGDPGASSPATFAAIIRGDEIDTTAGQLPIRYAGPEDADPAAAGWGPLRGVVPYSLHKKGLSFSVPLHLMRDQGRHGSLVYELESYQFGSLTRHVDSHVRGRSPTQ